MTESKTLRIQHFLLLWIMFDILYDKTKSEPDINEPSNTQILIYNIFNKKFRLLVEMADYLGRHQYKDEHEIPCNARR